MNTNPKANIYDEYIKRTHGDKKNQNKVISLPKNSPEFRTVYEPKTGVNAFSERNKNVSRQIQKDN